jgi:hypothetical protein
MSLMASCTFVHRYGASRRSTSPATTFATSDSSGGPSPTYRCNHLIAARSNFRRAALAVEVHEVEGIPKRELRHRGMAGPATHPSPKGRGRGR